MKKLISAILAMAMVATMGASAFAEDAVPSSEVTIETLTENISQEIVTDIKESVSSGLRYADGTVVPVDSFVTIEEAPVMRARSQGIDDPQTYLVTVRAGVKKTDSDTEDRNSGSKSASIYLQLTWTDNAGTGNVLNSLSTRLTNSGFKVTSGTLKYGDGSRSAATWTTKNIGSTSSYSISPNLTTYDPAASYTVMLEGELFSLFTTVGANVFQ
ncbi:MAG: hypothetical protein LBV43_00060 [Prevotella sp.]|nr:hypothetical protein [Prevotella sp.]